MAHDSFLRAILDSPDDDAPRLIYADWLDDHGHAERAEFIRVQCALGGPGAEGRRRELEIRELELLDGGHEEWAAPLRGLVDGWTFQRGFVSRVRVDGQRFANAPEAILRPAPVQALQLYWGLVLPPERAQILARACACPDLTRLRALDLSGNYLGSDGARALAACEYLAGLTELDLRQNHVGDAGMRALASSPFLVNLTNLVLSGNDIGPTGVRSLIAALKELKTAGRSPRLQILDLSANRLGMAGRQLIHSDQFLRRIAHL